MFYRMKLHDPRVSLFLCCFLIPMSSQEEPMSAYFPRQFLNGLTEDLDDKCEEETVAEQQQIAVDCLKQPWEKEDTVSENPQRVCDSIKLARTCVNNFLQNITDCTTEKMKQFGPKLVNISEILYGAVCDDKQNFKIFTDYLVDDDKCQVDYHQLLFTCLNTYVNNEMERSQCKNYMEYRKCVKDNYEKMDFSCSVDNFWKSFNIQAEAVEDKVYGQCPEVSSNDEMSEEGLDKSPYNEETKNRERRTKKNRKEVDDRNTEENEDANESRKDKEKRKKGGKIHGVQEKEQEFRPIGKHATEELHLRSKSDELPGGRANDDIMRRERLGLQPREITTEKRMSPNQTVHVQCSLGLLLFHTAVFVLKLYIILDK